MREWREDHHEGAGHEKTAGIEGVTPHMFRRTVASVVNEQAGMNLASELLGHTDPKVTIEHYIRRNEQVNPLTAELLDADE